MWLCNAEANEPLRYSIFLQSSVVIAGGFPCFPFQCFPCFPCFPCQCCPYSMSNLRYPSPLKLYRLSPVWQQSRPMHWCSNCNLEWQGRANRTLHLRRASLLRSAVSWTLPPVAQQRPAAGTGAATLIWNDRARGLLAAQPQMPG